MRSSTIATLGAALLCASVSTVQAQSAPSDKFSLNVNVGFQPQSRDVTGSGSVVIYEEDAPYTTAQTLDGGVIFDLSADYRVTRSIALGVGWSMYSKESSMVVTASVPHPLVAGQLRSTSVEADGAKHTTQTINIMAVWRYPFSRKMDLVVSAGPSIFLVEQDLLTGLTIAPETFPFSAPPTISSVSVASSSKTSFGFNAGVDAAYMVTPLYGVGGGIRYTFGSADFDGLTDSLTVGGFQILGGLRLRF